MTDFDFDFNEIFSSDKIAAAIESTNKEIKILKEVEDVFIDNNANMRQMIDVVAYLICSQNKYDHVLSLEVVNGIDKVVRMFNEINEKTIKKYTSEG